MHKEEKYGTDVKDAESCGVCGQLKFKDEDCLACISVIKNFESNKHELREVKRNSSYFENTGRYKKR